MKDMKRIISGLLVTAMLSACVACGAVQQGALTDTAAVRTEDADEGIYIDDDSIALAKKAKSSDKMTTAINSAFSLVNAQRKSGNVGNLSWSNGLADAARVRAQEIVTSFSHTRPNGAGWWTVNSKLQYGENLAKLYNSADSVVAAWMASPSHKANIMDAGFKTVGMSIYETSGQWYWAQEFGY